MAGDLNSQCNSGVIGDMLTAETGDRLYGNETHEGGSVCVAYCYACPVACFSTYGPDTARTKLRQHAVA